MGAFITRMDHFTVVTDRLDETGVFYQRLGLSPGPRPDFGAGLPGLWLYAGDHALLHLVQVAELPSPRRGVIDHIAFFGDDLGATLEHLRAERIAYRLIRQPRPWSRWQVFFLDPNGAEVEIDFEAGPTVAAHLRDGSVVD